MKEENNTIKWVTVGELFQNNPELIEEIKKDIAYYSDALIGVGTRGSVNEVELIGSGTLVNIEKKFGILTAKHVVEKKLKKYDQLGLGLSEKEIYYTIPRDHIQVVTPASGNVDLAFLILPDYSLGDIKSKSNKVFYNLSKRRTEALQFEYNAEIAHNFLWVVCGFVGVWTKGESFKEPTKRVYSFNAMCGFGDIEQVEQTDEYDQYKTNVKYDTAINMPSTFKGVSGGGLWRVTASYDSGKATYTLNASELWGVAYYQTEDIDNSRSIICNGPRSIYKKLYQAVLDS